MTHSQSGVAPCRAARCGTPRFVTPPSPSPFLLPRCHLQRCCGESLQSTGHCWGCTARSRAPGQGWWHRGWQLGSEELLTQTFPSQVHGPKVAVGLMCASGWISHRGYWGLFFSTNYLLILKRHLERDQASRGTEIMKALGKQEPGPQPSCGTMAMPQQGVLVGIGVLQFQPVPHW